MIEQELVGSIFLKPMHGPESTEGYISRETYFKSLKQGAEIGVYDSEGRFIVDDELTTKYQNTIPLIADALIKDPRDPEYQKYKLAALEKGNLSIRLEWDIAKLLETRNVPLETARLFRNHMGFTTLLLDLNGPSYEVVTPDTIDVAIEKITMCDAIGV